MNDLSLTIGRGARGPLHTPSGRPGSGLEGAEALALELRPGRPGTHRVGLEGAGAVVAPGDELRYLVFPESGPDEVGDERWWTGGFAATGSAVDIVFDDGSRLSDADGVDQHGIPLSAEGRGGSRAVLVDQWNLVRIPLDRWAGRRVAAIEGVVTSPEGEAARAWIDGLRIAPAPAQTQTGADLVDTRRGTHSTADFSRGHTVPAAGVLNAFHLVLPVTDAGDPHRPFKYHADHDEQNRLGIEAIASCHTATPWLGDYGILHVMPVAEGSGYGRKDRRRTTDHSRLVTRPHLIAAEFDDGGTVQVAPTRHGFVMRATGCGAVVFDQVDDQGAISVQLTDGVAHLEGVAGFVHPLSDGASPVYFAARVCNAARGATTPIDDRSGVGAVVEVGGECFVVVSTSLLGADVARARLDDEVAVWVDEAATEAKAQWDRVIDAVRVEGATPEQRATLAACLYRLFLYPSALEEDHRGAKHRIIGGPRTGELAEGALTVGNGFWDTYRTCWPAYSLLAPERTARLLDGLTQHARDAGWIPRWSAPSAVDCMVGTSSDAVFADAVSRGVDLEDPWGGFDAAVRNATVPSPEPAVGRKGIGRGAFLGYIPSDVPEAMSWSLDNAVNDWALAQWARRLADGLPGDHPRRLATADLAAYLEGRAGNAALLFDRDRGFFRGRSADGSWSMPDAEFDPRDWGGDYTETNAWGMAFTMTFDGRGLAWLHGGPRALGDKLDKAFVTPTARLADHVGHYGFVIHEMTEARAIRSGQVALSNQPAHHTPFMYAFSDRPWRTQQATRDALRRLFVGGEIGQGWPGDEDNGEMSGWYIFAALGLYPLVIGEPGYVLTAPLFDRMELRLPRGAVLGVTATNNEGHHDFIQSVTIDGEPWRSTWVPHAAVAGGAEIVVELGPEPSHWFTEQPPARTVDGEPLVLLDESPGLWGRAEVTASFPIEALVDDDSSTRAAVPAGGRIEWAFEAPTTPAFLTVTAGDPAAAPSAWRVSARVGKRWFEASGFSGERFEWDGQTRPFSLPDGEVDAIRVEFVDGGEVAEVELLTFRAVSHAHGW